LSDSGIRVYSTHPGWVETPGVAEALPVFRRLTRPLLGDTADGADTTVWLVASRPDSGPSHFWHDRAQRPTTVGWERGVDPQLAAEFFDEVSALCSSTTSSVINATNASASWALNVDETR
jgi:dehydrogenase/reductase SDR family protein 12